MTSRPSPGRSFIWLVLLLAFLVSGTLPAVAVGPIIGVDERGLPVALDVMRQPVSLSRTPSKVARHTPERGEHTDEVLTEFGFTADEIAALRAANAL